MSDFDIYRTQALEAVPVGFTGEEELFYQRFELSVIEGPDQAKTESFATETVQVGTARASDFLLTDPWVSRFHFRIDTEGGKFTISDANSTNGTYLGGHRIRSAFLHNETVIGIGNSKLRFRPLSDDVTVTVPARSRMGALIGQSTKMRQLYSLIERIAKTSMPVIIEGETGTGKELVARSIHDHSPRKDHVFEVLDCGSVPESLIQSELFGHVKGAYTGADRDRAGIFERADGGTVFLDELGELKTDMQPKLLRVLESGEIRRVGDDSPITVDVRVLCATHRSLRELVNKAAFREDLYYRLSGYKLGLPPLRDRREDIPLLVSHFLAELKQSGHDDLPDQLADEIVEAFLNRNWPGNVRQLRSAVSRASMGFEELAAADGEDGDAVVPIKRAREEFERRYLKDLLARFDGDVDRSAEASEMHPKSLARLLRKYGMVRQKK